MKEEYIALENRRLIYDYMLNNPGSHLRRISGALNMHLSTLRYHIHYLEKRELVVSKKEKNLRIYFIAGKVSDMDKNIVPLLQQKRFRDIVLTIIITPRLTHAEISDKLAIKPPTLSKYISVLEDRGIIYHEKIGREKRYCVSDEKSIMELLLTYKKSFWDSLVDNVLEIYFER